MTAELMPGSGFLREDEERYLDEIGRNAPGFISDFQRWVNQQTDAPPFLVRVAAYQALSLAAGDGIQLDAFGAPLWLNLYTITIGDSSISRKSHVLKQVKKVLPAMVDGSPLVTVLDDVSPQAMNKVLGGAGATKTPVLMSLDEVGPVLTQMKQAKGYQSTLPRVLLNSYDHSPINIIRTSASVDVPDGAFLNLYAATTPAQIEQSVDESQMRDGLLPRFLVFLMDDYTAWAPYVRPDERPPVDENEQKRLRKHLEQIAAPVVTMQQAAGNDPIVLTMSPEAFSRWSDTEEAVTAAAKRNQGDVANAIRARALVTALKIAALNKLSRAGLDEDPVELEDMLRALDLMGVTMHDLVKLSESVGQTASTMVLDYVAKRVKDAGPEGVNKSKVGRLITRTKRGAIEDFPGGLNGVLQRLVGNGVLIFSKEAKTVTHQDHTP